MGEFLGPRGTIGTGEVDRVLLGGVDGALRLLASERPLYLLMLAEVYLAISVCVYVVNLGFKRTHFLCGLGLGLGWDGPGVGGGRCEGTWP